MMHCGLRFSLPLLVSMMAYSSSEEVTVSTERETLTWAGPSRVYVKQVPSSGEAPTGLIVILSPGVTDGNVEDQCAYLGGDVAASTGALVVCPSSNGCWKAFEANGYCLGGQPECSEDVDFIAAVIVHLQRQYSIPEGKVIVSGFSNGGSMAYRFYCEKSELIGGLVVVGQSWFDPIVGFYDYVNDRVPEGPPQCDPTYRRPLYTVVGTDDNLYGQPPATAGFEAVDNWQQLSTQVLGCEGNSTTVAPSVRFPQGATTCFEYPSCPSITSPGLNRMFSVAGMGHEGSPMVTMLTTAFRDFFGGDFDWVTSEPPAKLSNISCTDYTGPGVKPEGGGGGDGGKDEEGEGGKDEEWEGGKDEWQGGKEDEWDQWQGGKDEEWEGGKEEWQGGKDEDWSQWQGDKDEEGDGGKEEWQGGKDEEWQGGKDDDWSQWQGGKDEEEQGGKDEEGDGGKDEWQGGKDEDWSHWQGGKDEEEGQGGKDEGWVGWRGGRDQGEQALGGKDEGWNAWHGGKGDDERWRSAHRLRLMRGRIQAFQSRHGGRSG